MFVLGLLKYRKIIFEGKKMSDVNGALKIKFVATSRDKYLTLRAVK